MASAISRAPTSATAWTAFVTECCEYRGKGREVTTRRYESSVAICRLKVGGEGRDAVAGLYPTAEEARITCAIVNAAAEMRDLNFKYLAERKDPTMTVRFGPMVWPSAPRTARVKGWSRCFSGFTWSRFDLLFGAGSNYQQLTSRRWNFRGEN